MSCGKCGAGKGALYTDRRMLENGTTLEETSCLLCGWLVSNPVFPRAHRPALTAAVRATPIQQQRKYPCTRSGCNGSFAKTNNKFSLCPSCSTAIRRWQATAMTTPPPMIKTADGWADNPEPKGAAL